MLEFQGEIHIVDRDVWSDFQDDGREIQDTLDASGNEAIHDRLGELDRDAKDGKFHAVTGDERLQIRVGQDGYGGDACASGFRVGVEGCDDFEAFFFESVVTEECGTEIAGTDEDHRLEVFAAEGFTDGGGEDFHGVAEAAGAELAEISEVFAELGWLDASGAGKRRGAHRVHTIGMQLLQAAMIDRQTIDRFLGNVDFPRFVGIFHEPGDAWLKFFRLLQKGGNAVEKDTGTTAIDHSVVESE